MYTTDLPGGGRVVDLLAMTPASLSERAAAVGRASDPALRAVAEAAVGMRKRLLGEIKKEFPGMRVTSLQMYATGAEHVELATPPPGHWHVLGACAAEPGTPPEAQGVVAFEERATGIRLPTALAGHGLVMRPGMFEGGDTSISLYPHSGYTLADMVPKDPSRACSYCATAGVRLHKCAACRSARYCSREHQVAHWKAEHRQDCRAAVAAAAAQQGDNAPAAAAAAAQPAHPVEGP